MDMSLIVQAWTAQELFSGVLAARSEEVAYLAEYRYGGLMQLGSELRASAWAGSLTCARRANGSIVGWAGILPFHSRPGYAGTAQLVLDVAPADFSSLAPSLFKSCCTGTAGSPAVIIAFARGDNQLRIDGLLGLGFEGCGQLDLGDGCGLRYFAKGGSHV